MKVGLVLSGGMGKGAYQIGALKAISSYLRHTDFDCVSCSSVGVLNGYAFSTGHLREAEDIWLNLCHGENGMFISRIAKSDLLQKSVTEFACYKSPLSSPFYCSLLDMTDKAMVYQDISRVPHTQLSDYLRASIAIPTWHPGVVIDNHRLFDGAFVDNIPVYPLVKKNLDYIICIFFDNIGYRFENSGFDNKIIKICFPPQSDLRQTLVLRNDRIIKMINTGYDVTASRLDDVFAKGEKNLDMIYQNIRMSNRMKDKTVPRVTVDFLASNLNKITQKFTDKKII